MPSSHRTLTPERAAELIACSFTAPPSTGTRVGVEIEWLTYTVGADGDASRPPSSALGELAAGVELTDGSTLTFEPGGQLEVSTAPAPGVDAACDAVEAATRALAGPLEAGGIRLLPLGLDPERAPRRVTDNPRYVAMEAYFDRLGRLGRQMMCGTAAVQVNLDLGPTPATAWHRWAVAHAVGPVLTATFANSPLARGQRTGRRSTRMAVWAALDPLRTAPVDGDPARPDPADAWARYALAAPVMLFRDGDEYRPALNTLPLGAWVAGGGAEGDAAFPTEDDVVYHLTTLFPPVRPRGWLELRMIDALPDPWWRVAVAITTALVTDEAASSAAIDACHGASDWWATAARDGLDHPTIAGAAKRCFDAALDALPALGVGAATRDACSEYRERYVARGRCPADDVLDTWTTQEATPSWT